MITDFRDKCRFLSNFFLAPMVVRDVRYPSMEYAFVACKAEGDALRLQVMACPTPEDAKRLGPTCRFVRGETSKSRSRSR